MDLNSVKFLVDVTTRERVSQPEFSYIRTRIQSVELTNRELENDYCMWDGDVYRKECIESVRQSECTIPTIAKLYANMLINFRNDTDGTLRNYCRDLYNNMYTDADPYGA